jgi:hypothetical protein
LRIPDLVTPSTVSPPSSPPPTKALPPCPGPPVVLGSASGSTPGGLPSTGNGGRYAWTGLNVKAGFTPHAGSSWGSWDDNNLIPPEEIGIAISPPGSRAQSPRDTLIEPGGEPGRERLDGDAGSPPERIGLSSHRISILSEEDLAKLAGEY